MEAQKVDYKRNYFNLLFRYNGLFIKRMEIKRQMDEAENFVAFAEKERSIENVSKQLAELNAQIKELRDEISKTAEEAEKNGCVLELEKICRKYNLSQIEKDVLIVLILYRVPEGAKMDFPTGTKILDYIAESRADEILSSYIFFDNSPLLKNGLISRCYHLEATNSPYYVPEHIMRKIVGCPVEEGEEKESVKDEEVEEETVMNDMGLPIPPRSEALYEERRPRISLSDVVLTEEARSDLMIWLKNISTSENVLQKWGIKENIVNYSNNILLLYGPPGTGKTMLSEAIAYELNIPLLIARFDQLLNCWQGNTEKNIVNLFKSAQKKKAVLLFDECDSLFSARYQVIRSHESWENRIKNMLLQQTENYHGVLILATNLVENLDEAFERRIGMKIHLPVPSAPEREKIWRSFFTNPNILADDVNFEKLAADYEFSGGFIKNAVVKAIKICEVMGRKLISQEILEKAAKKEQQTRWSAKSGKKLGFCMRQ